MTWFFKFQVSQEGRPWRRGRGSTPHLQVLFYTAKTQYRKFETNIHRKRIAWPQSQFPHSCVCKRFIYSHDRSAYSAAGKYVDQSWERITHSQTHIMWKFDWGRAIPCLGIYKWEFCCSAHLGTTILTTWLCKPFDGCHIHKKRFFVFEPFPAHLQTKFTKSAKKSKKNLYW